MSVRALRSNTITLVFTTVFVGGCADTPVAPENATAITRDTTALFQTDSLGYTLIHRSGVYHASIQATLTNRAGGSIYISNCAGATGIYLQKRTATGWEIVRSPILPACLSPPIVVAVATSYAFEVDLVGGDPGSNLAPRYGTTDLNGEYRLLWDSAFVSYDANSGSGTPLPETERVSNHFLIRVVDQ